MPKKKPTGRPPSENPTAARYTVNLTADEDRLVTEAATAEKDEYTGRWIKNAALERAKSVVDAAKERKGAK